MGQENCYFFKRPTLLPGVTRNRHRCATAEGSEETIVRSWPRVGPTKRNWFVTGETMRADLNLLRKAACAATNNYMRQIVGLIVFHCEQDETMLATVSQGTECDSPSRRGEKIG